MYQEEINILWCQLILLHHLLDADGWPGDGKGEHIHAVDQSVFGRSNNTIPKIFLYE